MKKLSVFSVISIMLVILASTASAGVIGTIKIEGGSFALSDSVILYGGSFTGGPAVPAGIFKLTTSNPTGAGVEVPNYGFCIELPQSIAGGYTYTVRDLEDAPLPVNASYSAATPMGPDKAALISELWGRHFNTAWLVQGGTTGGIANSQLGEAFGVAIWEIVWETDTLLDVTVGNGFRAENVEQSALANQWLDSLDGTGPMADTVALSNNDRQDFVTVPEPASMALLVLGALVLKRKRK